MKIAVFGVFDRLHPGHLYFLYHARLKGEELFVIVARDASVKRLKNKKPKENEKTRMRRVKDSGLATRVVLGDKKDGGYSVLKKLKADAVVLGYDQKGLGADLRRAMKLGDLSKLRILTLKAYKPSKFHTSRLS
jgi:FAD synthetase